MLLTTIPFFRDVLLMAFNCQFCGHKSNEVKVGGQAYLLGFVDKFLRPAVQSLRKGGDMFYETQRPMLIEGIYSESHMRSVIDLFSYSHFLVC